ncbi:hypothetical protein [Cyanothece sp. BG0011]|uniref:hypothetical protein n=2 Tax=Cyanothece sp. BG0011 TaxID=2082950 RepID=UPI000D1DE23D|nr:hypothetical protein [Cyanothece sp. BG0011]
MQWHCQYGQENFTIRLSDKRLAKLRLYAQQKDKTMTQVLEECIDKLRLDTEVKTSVRVFNQPFRLFNGHGIKKSFRTGSGLSASLEQLLGDRSIQQLPAVCKNKLPLLR